MCLFCLLFHRILDLVPYRSVAYSVVLPRDFHNRLGCYVTGLILCCLASNYDCDLSILVWRYNRIGVA